MSKIAGVPHLRAVRALEPEKLTGKALAKFEAERDVWQEVLDGVKEIKAGGSKRKKVEPKSHVVSVRLNST